VAYTKRVPGSQTHTKDILGSEDYDIAF